MMLGQARDAGVPAGTRSTRPASSKQSYGAGPTGSRLSCAAYTYLLVRAYAPATPCPVLRYPGLKYGRICVVLGKSTLLGNAWY
eukprot:1536078-Rhodomonas_salina.2